MARAEKVLPGFRSNGGTEPISDRIATLEFACPDSASRLFDSLSSIRIRIRTAARACSAPMTSATLGVKEGESFGAPLGYRRGLPNAGSDAPPVRVQPMAPEETTRLGFVRTGQALYRALAKARERFGG